MSGSWETLAENTGINTFDIVLMSETLYNTDYYPSLVSLLDKVTGPEALIVIGTKTFYYGLGGGFYQFQLFLQGSSFGLETYAKFNDMKSIERMILVMRKTNSQLVQATTDSEDDFKLAF
mgnify:CR=1 FL=1